MYMINRSASTAVLTKTRAKFGDRLKADNFKSLISMASVADIAAYLKSNTHFSDVLKNINESAVHRGNLESILRSKIYTEFAELCNFEKSVGDNFFEFITRYGEINELLSFLRYLNAGNPGEYLLNIPDFFNKHTPLDLVALSQVKTYEELLGFLSHSPYHDLFSLFETDEGKPLDIMNIEAALFKYLYNFLFNLIKHSPRPARKELTDIFNMKAELDNIRRIYRSKKYFGVSKEVLIYQMLPYRYKITRQQMDKMLSAENSDEVIEVLRNTYYARRHNFSEQNIDESCSVILYKYLSRKIRYTKYSSVAMACYFFLFEYEVDDITNIIEAVRYKVAFDEYKDLMMVYS